MQTLHVKMSKCYQTYVIKVQGALSVQRLTSLFSICQEHPQKESPEILQTVKQHRAGLLCDLSCAGRYSVGQVQLSLFPIPV
jgi:hypothetical protein